MRLSLHCVGGFTGPAGAQTRCADLDHLPEAEGTHLRSLVQALDLPRLPGALMKQQPQPWDFVYTLTIENGDRHVVRFQNDAAPPALRELADLLSAFPPS